jgi:hypothetical protein
MNLRLSHDGIRIRTTTAEFEKLLSGRSISLELALPRDHVYRANVRPSPLSKWELATDPTGLWLTVPVAELQAFSESLPNRKGLEHAFDLANGGSVVVTMEVDVKDGRSRNPKSVVRSP